MSEPRTDAVLREWVQNIAESVKDLVGFETAAIHVRRDDGTFEIVAVAGSEDARATLVGKRSPLSEIEADIEHADRTGTLCFVPQERTSYLENQTVWVADFEPLDHPDAWQPFDLLLGLILDDDGELRGLLSVDLPLDLMRPDEAKLTLLQRYVDQLRRALLTGMERDRLAEQVRLAEAARTIVRDVSSELSLERIVQMSQSALTSGFDLVGMWIQTFDEDGDGTGAVYTSNGVEISMPDDLKRIARHAVRLLWSIQDVAVITDTIDPPVYGMAREQEEAVYDFMATIDVSSMLLVPLGAGRECLGNLVLCRRGSHVRWSDIEKTVALDIGRDLGRALFNARTYEKERLLVDELRELDGYKSRLIATISHELKNPLTSILGHVEMLDSVPDLTGSVRSSISSMERGAVRMQRLIDDLLVLARVGDPNIAFVAAPVDLRALVDDVLDLLRVTMERKELKVVVDAPEHPVRALGEEAGLDRVCANLISNAAKYTPDGGTVTVSLRDHKKLVELSVTDTGLGISEKDQERLFQEFFRSTNPAAVAQPGTGLGLSIVQRIVERHSGRIRVESTLGVGTTFTVVLPAADDS